MRLHATISTLALALAAGLAGLLGPAASAQTTSAAAAQADPVVASVNGYKIHFSDIQADAQSVPQQLQQLPPDQLFPILVKQEIDRKALLVAARKEGLEHNPAVAQAMEQAADIKLENAYVQLAIAPAISQAAIQAAYKADYVGNSQYEEVDARHILVKTQAEAQSIIDQLNHGADFATLAKKYSTDPGAANGGELGWFAKDQMVKPFADAAFALQPGKYTETPVQSQFGWHVILCEAKRTSPLADVQDQIRQQLADNAINATLDKVRAQVKIEIYNADGTPGPQNGPVQ